MKLLAVFMLLFSFSCFSQEDLTLEERVQQLENNMTNLTQIIEQKCTLEVRYAGHFSGWCPRGAFVNRVDIRNFAGRLSTWVDCYYYQLRCQQ